MISASTFSPNKMRWRDFMSSSSIVPKNIGGHSDFEKKFIRAEVVNWKALVDLGGYAGVREKGLLQAGRERVHRQGRRCAGHSARLTANHAERQDALPATIADAFADSRPTESRQIDGGLKGVDIPPRHLTTQRKPGG